jgi:hypothetical protein
MPTIQCSIDVDMPAAAVFALSQDYGRRAWDPFLRRMRFLDGATEAAPGVRVWVKARNGLAMEVRYTTVDRPGHVAVSMVRGPWWLRTFAGGWRFREAAAGHTQVVFRYHFSLRALGAVFDRPVAWALRRAMDARVRALKRAAEERAVA